MTWDGSSSGLAGYTLEGFIPDDLKAHSHGVSALYSLAVVAENLGGMCCMVRYFAVCHICHLVRSSTLSRG